MGSKAIWFVIIFILLFVLGGIGYYYHKNQEVDILEEPQGGLPPMPDASKFLGELDKENFQEVAEPDRPELLAWDFSANKVCAYDYTQRVENSISMEGMDRDMIHSMDTNGDVILRGKGNGTADMVLKNMNMKTTMNFRAFNINMPVKTPMAQDVPLTVFQDIKESGESPADINQPDPRYQYLFPLPGKVLMVGESVELPTEMPFNALGYMLHGKGTRKIMLTNYVTANGHKTARLEAVIDISKLDLPDNLKGTCRLQVKRKSVFYFDVEDRCFHSGASAILMSVRVNIEIPKMDSSHKDITRMDMSQKMRMVMDSDNLITVVRNHEKEQNDKGDNGVRP